MSNKIGQWLIKLTVTLLQLPFLLGSGIFLIFRPLVYLLQLIVKSLVLLGTTIWKGLLLVSRGTFFVIRQIALLWRKLFEAVARVCFNCGRSLQQVMSTLAGALAKKNQYGVSLLSLFFSGVNAGLIIVLAFLGWTYVIEQPYPRTLTEFAYPQSLHIYDNSNVLLYQAYDQPPQLTTELSPFVKNATVATEDTTFYSTVGIDWQYAWNSLQGASNPSAYNSPQTITHQLSHRMFSDEQPSLKKILKEVLLTLKLEEAYTKDQLLSIYLATSAFGSSVGLENAATTYFGTSSANLSAPQVVYLLALLQAESPTTGQLDQQEVAHHYKTVLQKLERHHIISPEQTLVLATMPLVTPQASQLRASNAVKLTLEEAQRHALPFASDTILHTSINSEYQNKLQQLILEQVSTAYLAVPQLAVLLTDRTTGKVLAFTGVPVSPSVREELVAVSQKYSFSYQPHILSFVNNQTIQPAETSVFSEKSGSVTATASASTTIAIWVNPSTNTENPEVVTQVIDAISATIAPNQTTELSSL